LIGVDAAGAGGVGDLDRRDGDRRLAATKPSMPCSDGTFARTPTVGSSA
jgi:hypothetical protein